MTSKLTEMWTALAEYQPQADKAGHGGSWAEMCSTKVLWATRLATQAARDAGDYAAYASATAAAAATNYAQEAIDHIIEAQAQGETE